MKIDVKKFEGKKIPYGEALHNSSAFLLYNSKEKLVTGPFHCKDFFNEIWFSHFHSKARCSRYGYTWKPEDDKLLSSTLTFVVFAHDGGGTNVGKVVEITNGQNGGDFIDFYLKDLNLRNVVSSIRVYKDRIEMDVKKYIFKYPTIASLLTYILRTGLDAAFSDKDYVEVVKDLKLSDGTYYTQHADFLRILESKEYRKNIKKLKWKVFNGGNTFNYLCAHNNSGFCSYVNYMKENTLNNIIKIK